MYLMAGLLVIGLICNLCVRPVAERYYVQRRRRAGRKREELMPNDDKNQRQQRGHAVGLVDRGRRAAGLGRLQHALEVAGAFSVRPGPSPSADVATAWYSCKLFTVIGPRCSERMPCALACAARSVVMIGMRSRQRCVADFDFVSAGILPLGVLMMNWISPFLIRSSTFGRPSRELEDLGHRHARGGQARRPCRWSR